MFELDSYLARIGLGSNPGIAEIHRAHATSIPFENLDPQRGVPVSLEEDALFRKLVRERRGGYCFEQNLVLKLALEALGYEVDSMLARVRVGAPAGAVRSRSHLVLRVKADGAVWHADVGFGGTGSLLEPIPFGPGEAYDQSGWQFRVVRDGQELVLQTRDGDEWRDLYGFVPEPAPFVDLETSNWFTSTHPSSRFVTGLNIGILRHAGTRLLLSDWRMLALTEQSPSSRTVTPIERHEIPRLLETYFDLPGFVLDGDGRVVPAT